MEKQTLPGLRVSSETITNLKAALAKLNETQFAEMTLADFRRLSYEFLSQTILKGGVVNVKLRK
jgi:hypothetical protein